MWSVLLGLLLLVVTAGTADATCSGSGLVWSCTAGTTPAQVNTAIASATDGATITFASGAYTWGTGTRITPSVTKAVTLLCGVAQACTVASGSTVFDLPAGDSTNLFRISGFAFSPTGGQSIIWTCPGGGCTNTWTQLRFDHNTVTGDIGIITVGENSAQQYVYGVIDHNTITTSGSTIELFWLGVADATPAAPPLGTINNLFFEDNVIVETTLTNLGSGCMDGWGQMAVVWRHNTSTNCRVITHGVSHGGGPSNVEVYDNLIQMDANSVGSGGSGCYRCLHHQGSNTYLAFNNRLQNYSGSAKDGVPAEFLHYCSSPNCSDGGGAQCDGTQSRDGNRSPTTTWRGYPCWRQPGRDVTGAYKPMYFWNNRWADTLARIDMGAGDAGGSPDYFTTHIVANREYYNAVSKDAQTTPTSPFNGTTGMGFGTLANRPTTCTASSEVAFGGAAGVGYFATDQGTQGQLYTCSATDTWTLYYTPYTYPHPLVGGAVGTVPTAPSGLTVTQP